MPSYNYGVVILSGNSNDNLERTINEFLVIKKGEITVINLSLSTCWDQENNCVLYTAAIAYSYMSP